MSLKFENPLTTNNFLIKGWETKNRVSLAIKVSYYSCIGAFHEGLWRASYNIVSLIVDK